MTSLFALVDCNNFYASCERVFRPDLEKRPVVVLSNNDGCIIALSNEAKDLGIVMGTPYFKLRPFLEKEGVSVFSSNYELYGDMSRRVVGTLQQFTPNLEVYSIDESFLDLGNFYKTDIKDYATTIRKTVKQWTGIPVTVGVAPTKTLAKVANRLSKKSEKTEGVLVLQSEQHIEAALKKTEVGSVWGIGRKYAQKLISQHVLTAWDLRNVSDAFARKHLTIEGVRIVKELRGEPCIDLELMPQAKKSMCMSRSFGRALTKASDLEEALASHTIKCGAKLRKQKACAGVITVFLMTDRFKEQNYYYSKSFNLDSQTSSELELLKFVRVAIDSMYTSGLHYKKAGVILSDIVPSNQIQLSLLNSCSVERDSKLMGALDNLRAKYGNDIISCGIRSKDELWKMLEKHRSPRYTTRINEIPIARC